MPARRPEDADTLVCQAISKGDIEAALALYEPNASFVPEPGKVVTGKKAIREAMAGMAALKPKLSVDVKVVQSGDIAMLYSSWSLKGTNPDGSAASMSGKGREVVRRQPNGDWLFVIDDPNGGG